MLASLDDVCGPNYYPNVRLVHYADGTARLITRVGGRKIASYKADAMAARLSLDSLDAFIREQPASKFKPGFEIHYPGPDTERIVYHEYANY